MLAIYSLKLVRQTKQYNYSKNWNVGMMLKVLTTIIAIDFAKKGDVAYRAVTSGGRTGTGVRAPTS